MYTQLALITKVFERVVMWFDYQEKQVFLG